MVNYRELRNNIADDYAVEHGKEYGEIYSQAYSKKFLAVKKEKENTRVLGFWNGWSTTKTWKAAWLLPSFGDDSIFGPWLIAFFGGQASDPNKIFKAESYKDAERKADAAASEAAYVTAVKNGLTGEELAPFAERAKAAEDYATKSKERHGGTFGTLLGIAAAVAAIVFLGPIGIPVAIGALIGMPLAGFAKDRIEDNLNIKSSKKAGKLAAVEAEQGKFLPSGMKALDEAKSKTPEKGDMHEAVQEFIKTPTEPSQAQAPKVLGEKTAEVLRRQEQARDAALDPTKQVNNEKQ